MTNQEDDGKEFETRKVFDHEKFWSEMVEWDKKSYSMCKSDFVIIVFCIALFPILLPLWVAVSLAKHFNGKDLWKKEAYKVVEEE